MAQEKNVGEAQPKTGVRARRRARRLLVQALYQRLLAGTPEREIEQQFREDQDMSKADTVYFHELLVGISREEPALAESIAEFLDRKLEELDPVEYAILQIGAYELLNRLDIPYRVVINESVELAKVFGATDSYKYVNSILDHLSDRHRMAEKSA